MVLDIGSTTIKIVITDEHNNMLYHQYRRHLSDMRNTLATVIKEAYAEFPDALVTINVTGSGGISVSQWLGVGFIQEVIASTECIKTKIPETNVAIELGGEDAKLTFFDNGIDQRMNETCAGGTGAFIDQMAVVLQTDAAGLNEMAKNYKTIYPIAARCGVFAKTDVLPLLNEGAAKEDIAVSIFQAVVDQTIGGLACGRTISGNVAFLGGPLFFLSELRQRFIETLHLKDDEIIILVGNVANNSTITDNIILVDRTSNTQELASFYNAASVYVSMSTEETFGLTIAEALSCGTPAIVYNATACAEMVSDGENGYVVTPHDINQVYKCIQKIREAKDIDKNSIAQNAREKYSISKMINEYLSFYRGVIDDNIK